VFVGVMLFFIFGTAGIMKLTDVFHPETYNLLDAMFKEQFTPVWQAKIGDGIGMKLDPIIFKTSVGIAEVVCAALIVTPWRAAAGLFISLIMVAAMMTHVWLGEPAGFQALLIAASMSFAMFQPDEVKVKGKKQ